MNRFMPFGSNKNEGNGQQPLPSNNNQQQQQPLSFSVPQQPATFNLNQQPNLQQQQPVYQQPVQPVQQNTFQPVQQPMYQQPVQNVQPIQVAQPVQQQVDNFSVSVPTLSLPGVNSIEIANLSIESHRYVNLEENANQLGDKTVDALALELINRRGTDLHIDGNGTVSFRIKKKMEKLKVKMNNDNIADWLEKLVSENLIEEELLHLLVDEGKDLNFSYGINNRRFRAHVYKSRGSISVALRLLSEGIPSFDTLGLPLMYKELIDVPQGLILVTGATGSGKTTTIASILNEVNKKHYKHIVTLEDPIEYVFTEDKCVIHQREVGFGKDIPSFNEGVRSILREDPDVILVGEIRDKETMLNALTLASSGHVVFATLHTSGIIHTIGRILSMFNGDEELLVRSLLQDNLRCIINQVLYKSESTGEVLPILEHLFVDGNTYRIFNADFKAHQIKAILDTASNTAEQKVLYKWQSIMGYEKSRKFTQSEAENLIRQYDIDKMESYKAQRKF